MPLPWPRQLLCGGTFTRVLANLSTGGERNWKKRANPGSVNGVFAPLASCATIP
jgi:hypothetical protein